MIPCKESFQVKIHIQDILFELCFLFISWCKFSGYLVMFRCGKRMWVAALCCVCELGCILYYWHDNFWSSWICVQTLCQGTQIYIVSSFFFGFTVQLIFLGAGIVDWFLLWSLLSSKHTIVDYTAQEMKI